MTKHQSLHDRLVVRYGNHREGPERLNIPATGRIDADTVRQIQQLAGQAKNGDMAARDCLFFSLRPRLDRMGWILKPWPNTPRLTGLWDRDDVRQETWIVFVELLSAWESNVKFVPYLLARFSWRLRDRILRGIGKRQNQLGTIRISEEMLAELLTADDEEQPESVAVARKLLEELIRRQMVGESSPDELQAWLELINQRRTSPLVSPDQLLGENDVDNRSRVG